MRRTAAIDTARLRLRGLATEAAHAMLHFGFTTVGFERVFAITEAANTASVAVVQRLGIEFDTRFEDQGADRVRYVMTREAFLSSAVEAGVPPAAPPIGGAQARFRAPRARRPPPLKRD